MSSRLRFIVAVLAAFCGCAPASTERERGLVLVAPGFSLDAVRIQLSRSWPSAAGHVDVDGEGRFEVPPDAETVVAFLDVDASGVLELFEEPSAYCRRTGRSQDPWQCELGQTRLVAHRVLTARIGAGGQEAGGDRITVRAERYLADGAPEIGAQICLHDHEGVCAFMGGDPLGPRANGATAMSPCELEAALEPGAPIAVDVPGPGGGVVEVPYPVALSPAVVVVAGAGALTVRAHSDVPLTNAVAWYGAVDASAVHWSTEQEPAAMRMTSSEIEVTVPVARLPDCPDCKLMLQVARVEEAAGIGTFSEARYAIALDGR